MKIYNYDKSTKEFLNAVDARENPLEKGKFLIPANATTIEPLVDKVGFAVCFDEANNEWVYIEDNRGIKSYATDTKQEKVVEYIGAIESGFTDLVPAINDIWDGAKWVADIVAVKKSKLKLIKSQFNTVSNENVVLNGINWVGGFDSALKLDGAKRMAEIATQTEVTFFDADDTGHILSIADATMVVLSVAGKYQQDLAKYKSLKTQINAIDETVSATRTVEDIIAEVDAIVW